MHAVVIACYRLYLVKQALIKWWLQRMKIEEVEENKKDEAVMASEMEKVAVSSGLHDNEMVVDSSS